MSVHITHHAQDELVTLAEVAVAVLVTVALIVTAFLVGTWTV